MVAVVQNPDDDDDQDSPKDHPLNDLARLATSGPEAPGPTPGEKASQAQQEADAAAAFKQLGAGLEAMFLGALKALRTRIARTLPEINETWKDDVLRGPAAAAVPVVNKYASKLLPLLGDYPEEAVLCMSLLPLVMGYFDSMGAHAAQTVDTTSRPTP